MSHSVGEGAGKTEEKDTKNLSGELNEDPHLPQEGLPGIGFPGIS